MTNHGSPLEYWVDALTSALNDDRIEDVPTLLAHMAADGWADDAEQARHVMLQPTTTLATALGHDIEAARQLRIIQDAYRQGGLDVLRDVARDVIRLAAPEALELLLIEAVLALTAHSPGARRATEQAAFDLVEQANENEAIRKGAR